MSYAGILSPSGMGFGARHLDFPLYTLLYAGDSVNVLSQCKDIDVIGLYQNGISISNFLNHSASLPPTASSINSDSIVQ